MALILVGLILISSSVADGAPEQAQDEPDVVEVVEAAEPVNVTIERRLDCLSFYESHGNPSATNPTSKAAGEFQFLWSTWATTPQGRAGLSPYDPLAARNAARWMLNQGRAHEWVPVQRGLC